MAGYNYIQNVSFSDKPMKIFDFKTNRAYFGEDNALLPELSSDEIGPEPLSPFDEGEDEAVTVASSAIPVESEKTVENVLNLIGNLVKQIGQGN